MQFRKMMRTAFVLVGAAVLAVPAMGKDADKAGGWIKVPSAAIAANLEGNAADRSVYVVLPPGYAQSTEKHYPVVYFLHGYRGTPEKSDASVDFADAVKGAAAQGNEFILVVPDGNSKHGGAMYSNSPTTGNYEEFIVSELVAFVDDHYRTLKGPKGRGLAGHSMGGYGTFRLGMKYPGVFSSLYAMSGCCLSQRPITLEGARNASADDGDPERVRDFPLQSDLAAFAAWSPDPGNAPNFIDAGAQADGVDPLVSGRMAANAPLVMLSQYVSAMKSYDAIAFDVGNADTLIEDNTAMHELMTRFGIDHQWMVYEGDHGNRVAERLRSHVLPFFAQHLDRAQLAK